MADISITPNSKKKQALRVDLTPMVDLGFLLITFFIFTTAISSQTMVRLVLPADSTDSTNISASGAITIVPMANGMKVINGMDWQHGTEFDPHDFKGVRHFLLQRIKEIRQQYGKEDKLFVVLKPHYSSHFGQLISLFDELKICDIKRYSLSELSTTEESLVAR